MHDWANPKKYKANKTIRENPNYQKGIYYLGNILFAIKGAVDYAHEDKNLTTSASLSKPLRKLEASALSVLQKPVISNLQPYFPGFPTLDTDTDFYLDGSYSYFNEFLNLLEREYRLSGMHSYEIPKAINNLIKKIQKIVSQSNELFGEYLFISKTYIQRRESSGKLLHRVPITKGEYQLLKALHENNGKRIKYETLEGKIKRIIRENTERTNPRNRIIQYYKGIKKKLGIKNKELITKDFYGLTMTCKSKKV